MVGILLSFISNYVISLYFPSEAAWRWMLGVVALPSAAFLALVPLIVESPRWLVKVGRTTDAGKVIERLGYGDVVASLVRSRPHSMAAPAEDRLFQQRYARSIFLAWSIAMFNQLSGINAAHVLRTSHL